MTDDVLDFGPKEAIKDMKDEKVPFIDMADSNWSLVLSKFMPSPTADDSAVYLMLEIGSGDSKSFELLGQVFATTKDSKNRISISTTFGCYCLKVINFKASTLPTSCNLDYTSSTASTSKARLGTSPLLLFYFCR